MFNIFNWLFKTKNNIEKETVEIVVPKEEKYKIPDEVIDTLNNWNKINNNSFTIDDILAGLDLNGASFIDIKSMNYPIYEDVWKIPGYVGSFSFYSSINKDNALNEYSKRFLDEIGENNNIRYIIHLCKDGIVFEMDYKLKVKDFRKFKITYKLENLNSEYKLLQNDEYSLVILEPNSIYSNVYDCVVCERFKDENGCHIIKINERLFDDIYTKIIKFKLKNDVEFNFPKETELLKKIGTESVSFPENIMAILINYLKKYNIDMDELKIEGINVQNKISRDISYVQNEDKIQVVLGKKDDNDIKQVLKTIDVFLEYENEHYVRTFVIKTSNSKDMKLKIYYNSSSFNDRDFNVIDYFMSYYPVGLIDGLHEWYSFDIHFRLLCEFCFNDNINCIDRINLEEYENGQLVDSNKWERYNQVQIDHSKKMKYSKGKVDLN